MLHSEMILTLKRFLPNLDVLLKVSYLNVFALIKEYNFGGFFKKKNVFVIHVQKCCCSVGRFCEFITLSKMADSNLLQYIDL